MSLDRTLESFTFACCSSVDFVACAKDIGLDPVGMGYVFSAFSWAYVIGQIPGGWLLDRFGSKRVYFWSIFIWSMFTLLQGFVDIFSGFGIIVALFTLRFLVGLAEAPSFPGNSRIVAAWFPANGGVDF